MPGAKAKAFVTLIAALVEAVMPVCVAFVAVMVALPTVMRVTERFVVPPAIAVSAGSEARTSDEVT